MTPRTFRFDHSNEASKQFFHLRATPRPDASATQWLCFRIRSEGMFTHSPASHFAVVLRARLGFDEAGIPRTISGRGITLGDTSLASAPADNLHAQAPGYGGARGAQVESFWPCGNFLYRHTQALPDGLRDGVDYTVTLHVNDARFIAFAIEPNATTLLAPSICVRDCAAHPVLADATGVLIGLGRGDAAAESGPWSVHFNDIATGWFVDT